MKSAAFIRPTLERAVLSGVLAIGMCAAFSAGYVLAPRAAQPVSDSGDALASIDPLTGQPVRDDAGVIGLDVYSEGGLPVGRLSAVLRGGAHEGYALIVTHDRTSQGLGEIAVPVSRLALRGDRVVLSAGSVAGEAPRWRI